ncbi:MAG: type IV pilin protein [Massilia sp.]
MNKSMKSAQSGFTLIELIVVIVILGILAATALPKFANLGGDARLASLNAAKGALSSTSAMVHGKFLVNTGAPVTHILVEDQDVTLTNGYPSASNQLVGAAGLTADYTLYGPGTAASAHNPSVAADEIVIVPASLANNPAGLDCFVRYKQAATGAAPIITLGAGTAALTAAACE